ncbi:Putative surface protein bspA-like (TvBspA-like-625) [Durusdinium trenchii]|uniref:Surface protein bspA-like (TvBspA-like-625) n=1 Tax=Durusdinium trenchii TaxID=1381693 RepID=A0ABP0SE53_9DINO
MSESFGHVRAQLISGQVCMVEGILPETTILDLKQKLKAWNPSEDDLTRQLSSVQLVVDGKRFEDDEMVVAAISPTSEVQVVFTNPAVECASQRCCCSWELLDVCIPESVGIIEDHAFNDCSLLLRVSIPKSVRRIGACAFAGCSSLESLVIPDSVTAIGDHAFEGCRSLGDLSLPSVVQIGSFAFESCTSLISVSLSNSLVKIGCRAFRGSWDEKDPKAIGCWKEGPAVKFTVETTS